jgi:predicted nucleic acid-binding protein
MILADTSVWIDHLRQADVAFAGALQREEILSHPFVIGEIACGNLRNRDEILLHLGHLPLAPKATDPEVMAFIESRSLSGRGLGLIDVHLLASTVLHRGALLWTHDRPLREMAMKLGVGYQPNK